jgi:hypothetical protein
MLASEFPGGSFSVDSPGNLLTLHYPACYRHSIEWLNTLLDCIEGEKMQYSKNPNENIFLQEEAFQAGHRIEVAVPNH